MGHRRPAAGPTPRAARAECRFYTWHCHAHRQAQCHDAGECEDEEDEERVPGAMSTHGLAQLGRVLLSMPRLDSLSLDLSSVNVMRIDRGFRRRGVDREFRCCGRASPPAASHRVHAPIGLVFRGGKYGVGGGVGGRPGPAVVRPQARGDCHRGWPQRIRRKAFPVCRRRSARHRAWRNRCKGSLNLRPPPFRCDQNPPAALSTTLRCCPPQFPMNRGPMIR